MVLMAIQMVTNPRAIENTWPLVSISNRTRDINSWKIGFCHWAFWNILITRTMVRVTITLPVVLYGCETWSLTVTEEQRLRVFENKVLTKIFGAKRDEITGEWRKLHNAELHALYSSSNIIRSLKSRRLRWAGHVARMEQSRIAYRVLVGEL